jgi:hypothetical protein
MVPCRFSFNLLFFGLGTSSIGRGSNLCFSIDRIALFHWTLDLRLLFKLTFIVLILYLTTCKLDEARVLNSGKPILN